MIINQYTLFLILAVLTAALSLGVAIYAFRHSHVPGANFIGVYHILVIGWLFFNSMELIDPTETGTLIYAKIAYFFIMTIPVFWLLFVLIYTGKRAWITPVKTALLFVPGILTLLMVWTNEVHGLIWKSISFMPIGNLLYMRVEHGTFFYVQMVYQYLLIVAGISFLVYHSSKIKTVYRNQTLALLIAAVIPFLFNVVYIFHLIPGLVKDFSPISFSISGFAITFGIFYYSLFDVVPISREVIVDYMQDAMLVVDHRDRIVDCNASARRLFNSCEGPIVPDQIENVLPEWQTWMKNAKIGEPSVIQFPHLDRQYEAKITLFSDFKDGMMAKLVLVQDVTERVKLMDQLNTYAITDPLVNIYNRRHFLELAEELLPKIAAQREQVSVLMIDLDHFKKINDTYGHNVGDQVLQMFGNDCRMFIRGQDILARFGGEEFVIMLPKVGLMQAYQIAERLRAEIEEKILYIAEYSIQITISIGVACIIPDANSQVTDLIDRADKAVYQAKQNGRNRVTLFYESEPI